MRIRSHTPNGCLQGLARRRRKLRGEGGMTLIELMIAIGVTAIGFVLMFTAIANISAASTINEDHSKSVLIMTSILEDLKSMSPDQLGDYQPPPMPGLGAGATIQVVCFNEDGDAVPLPFDADLSLSTFPNPTEVQTTLFWRDRLGRPQTTRVSSLYRR